MLEKQRGRNSMIIDEDKEMVEETHTDEDQDEVDDLIKARIK